MGTMMSVQNPFLSVDRQIMGDIYTGTEAMDNLLVLCDEFGSRFGGTDGERRAAEFLKSKLEEYGLGNVHSEPFDYTGWTRGDACLEIFSPVRKTIPCISLPHSPPAALEGEIIDMGDGSPEDFDRMADEIRGKIVMTTSVMNPKDAKRWIHRSEKFGRSLMAGATGFIFANHYPGLGPATGGIGNNGEGMIPGVSICKEDGAFITRLLTRRGDVRIRLVTTDRSRSMTSWNIIGDLPGSVEPDQMVMIGCHYDGHDISQGAGDPASGVVSVMEAARVLAAYGGDLHCTIRFALWGVEEIGLLGSRDYVSRHADELSRIRFYLNMDSAGTRSNKRDIILNEWPDLQPYFEGWAREMALEFKTGQLIIAYSDHFPFFLEGVPTGLMHSAERSMAGRGYGHSQYDTVDKVDLTGLREASSLAARLALRMASMPGWPAKRRDGAAVRRMLEGPAYKEEKAYRERLKGFYRKMQDKDAG